MRTHTTHSFSILNCIQVRCFLNDMIVTVQYCWQKSVKASSYPTGQSSHYFCTAFGPTYSIYFKSEHEISQVVSHFEWYLQVRHCSISLDSHSIKSVSGFIYMGWKVSRGDLDLTSRSKISSHDSSSIITRSYHMSLVTSVIYLLWMPFITHM